MRCPECGNECKKRFVEIKDAVKLQIKAEGYYCEECMKVFAVFEEK